MSKKINTTANNEVLEGQLTLEGYISEVEVAINQAYINLLIAIKNA